MDHQYYSIEGSTSAEWKDRGSRFIAFAFPVDSLDEVKKQIGEIKKSHPKATHHCFAYRIGTDGLLFRVNDDGEPSGTAGKPILGQIDSKNLTNTLVIVVRYFGGTLLGVPGLIQAYRTAAAECLKKNRIVLKNVERSCTLEFDYTHINQVMQVIKKTGLTVLERSNGIFCSYRIGIPVKDLSAIRKELMEIPGIRLEEDS